MNTDVEDLLREGMERFTADLRAPVGLARRAARRRRRVALNAAAPSRGSALIEPLFVTDPFEASIAASTHGQQVIARALAEAIERYLTGISR